MNPATVRKRAHVLHLSIYSIRNLRQMGCSLKDYWLKEFLQQFMAKDGQDFHRSGLRCQHKRLFLLSHSIYQNTETSNPTSYDICVLFPIGSPATIYFTEYVYFLVLHIAYKFISCQSYFIIKMLKDIYLK